MIFDKEKIEHRLIYRFQRLIAGSEATEENKRMLEGVGTPLASELAQVLYEGYVQSNPTDDEDGAEELMMEGMILGTAMTLLYFSALIANGNLEMKIVQ
jgi:hypothetical protein